jgi:hypothetical protein
MPPVRQNNPRRSPSTRSLRQPPSRLENVRTGIQQMFTGRSMVGAARAHSPESPKTPRLALGLQNFSSTRLDIPYLTRIATIPNPSNEPQIASSPESAHSPATPISSRPITPNSLRQQIQQPTISTVPSHVRHNSARRFVGIDPAEQHLAELADRGRRRRRYKSRSRDRRCAPKIKNRKIRSKILRCFISGLVSTFFSGSSALYSYG